MAWYARHDNGTLPAHVFGGYGCTRDELVRTRLGGMTPHRAEWFCDHDSLERARHRRSLGYEWRTPTSSSKELVAQLFAALHSRSVLLVGDSLTLQHFVSLFCLLHNHVIAYTTWRFQLSHGGSIEFAPSDYLVRRAPEGGFDRQLHFRQRDTTVHLKFLGKPNPRVDRAWTRLQADVIVLNTGAHWSRAELPWYGRAARAVMNRLQRHNGKIYYRTLQGIVGCGDGISHDWDVHPTFDAVWHGLALRYARLRILNVSVTSRTDGHCERCYRNSRHVRDCVHSCLPGPIDAWALLLGGALRTL